MTRAIATLALVVAATACTPEEVQTVLDHVAPARAAAAERGLTPKRFDRLVECESGANPTAVSPSGKYRGLGQFDRRTWDSVTSRWFPWLTGTDPATVDYHWQVAAIAALWSERGSSPWPVCGR